jgi:hypothetical protein
MTYRLRTSTAALVVMVGARASVAREPDGRVDRLELAPLAGTAALSGTRFAFHVRADRWPTSAELQLEWPSELESATSVRLDGTALDPCAERLTTCRVSIPLDRLGRSHTLDVDAADGPPRAVWLELGTRRIEVADELSLLPLPLVDAEADVDPGLDVVFEAPRPSDDMLASAAIVVSWFGARTKVPLTIRVRNPSEVLTGDAVVFATGHGRHERVRLEGRGRGEQRHHLLTFEAPDDAVLLAAVRRFPGRWRAASGAELGLEARAAEADTKSRDDALQRRDGALARVIEAGGDPSSKDATLEGVLRLPPDMFVWPRVEVPLWVDIEARGSVESAPTRVDLALNGVAMATWSLPSSQLRHRRRLSAPVAMLRGFNVLRLEVHRDRPVGLVKLLKGTRFELGEAVAWQPRPDVQTLLEDGHPFGLRPDFGALRLVLPTAYTPDEVESALSMMSLLGARHGNAATGLTLSTTNGEWPGEDVDLLVVGHVARLPPLHRAAQDRLTSLLAGEAPTETLPDRLADVVTGAGRLRAARRLHAWPGRIDIDGLLAGFPAPRHPERTAFLLTSPEGRPTPQAGRLQGDALTEGRGHDALLLSGTSRLALAIGTEAPRGRLPTPRRILRAVSRHGLLMGPLLLLSAVMASAGVRPLVERRARARLSSPERA